MREAFVKVKFNDDNKPVSTEAVGNVVDLSYIASVAVQIVSNKTEKSIESIANEIKEALIYCQKNEVRK